MIPDSWMLLASGVTPAASPWGDNVQVDRVIGVRIRREWIWPAGGAMTLPSPHQGLLAST